MAACTWAGEVRQTDMRQGRKFGCSVFLYTQSLFTFKPEVREIFTQAALTIYFGQTEKGSKQVAGALELDGDDKSKLAEEIMNLDKGQAVAWGRFIRQDEKMTNQIHVQVQIPLVKDFIGMEYFRGPLLLVDKTAGHVKTDTPSISV